MPEDYSHTMARLPDSELLLILESPAEFAPAAVDAAQLEWNARGLQESDTTAIRQRSAAVAQTRPHVRLAAGLMYTWQRFASWVQTHHPHMQLLIWACCIQFVIEFYMFLTVGYFSIPAYGQISLEWEFLLMDTLYSVAEIVSLACLVFLIKRRKWAYWLAVFSLTLAFSTDVLMLPTVVIDYWNNYIHWAGNLLVPYSLLSLFHSLLNGLGMVCSILILYLLTRDTVRERYHISANTMSRLIIAGATIGTGMALLNIYYWWQWQSIIPMRSWDWDFPTF